MKKSLLLFAFCSSILGATAQITITTTDVGGYISVYNGTDTIVASSMIGFPGASQTWNMTSLTADIKDTIKFMPYSSAPNSNFSGANLVMKLGYGTDYLYATNQWNGLFALGFSGNYGGVPANIKNTPAETILNFPATYGNAPVINNYASKGTVFYGQDPGIGFVIDSFRVNNHVKKTLEIDAWGNLTTPFSGSSYPVIRVKETKISHDTTDAYFGGVWYNAIDVTADSITSYAWWAKNIGYPLAKATMDSLGGVTQMEWLRSTAVGIKEQLAAATDVSVYPNPAQNEITFAIESSKIATIQIFDITGRIINSSTVKNDKSLINTSSFANGIYTYSIIGKDKEILHQGKFTISK